MFKATSTTKRSFGKCTSSVSTYFATNERTTFSCARVCSLRAPPYLSLRCAEVREGSVLYKKEPGGELVRPVRSTPALCLHFSLDPV